jgi:hypothetical protein
MDTNKNNLIQKITSPSAKIGVINPETPPGI